MKRHTDGQGDKQRAITLCGVNLFCKNFSLYEPVYEKRGLMTQKSQN
jgi:hypothetical protein